MKRNPYGLRCVGDRVLALKALEKDGSGPWSGAAWPLPENGKPGKWLSVRGQLIPCQRGIHGAKLADIDKWIGFAPTVDGKFINPYRRVFVIELQDVYRRVGDNKLIARRGRLLREVKLRTETWYEMGDMKHAIECARNALALDESIKAQKKTKRSS